MKMNFRFFSINNWSVSQRLTAFGLGISVSTAVLLGVISVRASQKAVLEGRIDNLRTICAEKTSGAESYFASIREQMYNFSQNLMIAEATDEFTTAFHTTADELQVDTSTGSDARLSCVQYFDTEYKPRLEEAGLSYRGATTYTAASNNGVALQSMYIGANHNAVGEKHQLDRAAEDCSYNELHGKYHPRIRDFLESFGYYDIFLFDTEGNLVYSVFKETDYATNFLTGPYADTNFGDVYRSAMASDAPGDITIRDFKFYEPSYGAPASFIGAPVFRGGKKVGVSIFQMPVDKINELMASTTGLGETGESYFVGPDKTMRSQGRFEDGNSILTTSIDTDAVAAGLAGQTDALSTTNRDGEQAVVSYSPLEIAGLNWIVVSEIAMEEIMAPARALRMQIGVFALIFTALASLAAAFFARTLTRPIQVILEATETLANGDLTIRLDDCRKDELGRLATAVNSMSDSLSDVVSGIDSNTGQVSSAATEIAASSEELAVSADQQTTQVARIAESIESLSASVVEVASKSTTAAATAQQARDFAKEGGEIVAKTVDGINSVAEQVDQSAKMLEGLGERSQEIGRVIDVINDIADQTNLLALNAAIEAARAGEHGRGFAVVADEVRKLADRTTNATDEVTKSIKEIQSETHLVIERMEEGRNQVVQGVELAKRAGESLESIVQGAGEVTVEIEGIASAAESQSTSAAEISNEIQRISEVISQSSEGANQASCAVTELSMNAESLKSMVGRFKVRD